MNRHRQRGYYLAEMVAYMGIFLVVANLGGALLIKTFRSNQRAEAASDRFVQAIRLGEEWRRDVRRAIKPPIIVDDGFIIQLEDRRASYLWYEGSLWTRNRDGAEWQERLRDVSASQFHHQAISDRRAGWRWEVSVATPRRPAAKRQAFSFLAVSTGEPL